jgi:hypothetical protein
LIIIFVPYIWHKYSKTLFVRKVSENFSKAFTGASGRLKTLVSPLA